MAARCARHRRPAGFALVQLGGSRAASPRRRPRSAQWSAPGRAGRSSPCTCRSSRRARCSCSTASTPAPNSERLWDPATGTFTPVPYGRNLFCAGHIQLADGRTLIVGGHINANDGLADTTIFNPATRHVLPRARHVRRALVPDRDAAAGRPRARVRAATTSSRTGPAQPPPFSDASVNSLPSVYNPKTNTWTDLTGARLTSPLYPFMFVLSDGRVFDAGPDTTTRILDPATWTWSTVGTSPIDGHSAVMYRPNKIMKSGTWADPDFNGARRLRRERPDRRDRHERADAARGARRRRWRSRRSYHNLTLLPDGTVLASGGGSNVGRRRHRQRRPAGRDLEPGHGDVDDGRRRCRTAASTTRPRCCCRTAAC